MDLSLPTVAAEQQCPVMPLGRGHGRLTLPGNWGQIDQDDGDLAFPSGRHPVGNSIHVLGVAVFASNRNRGRLEACKGCRRRFRPLDCGCVLGSGAKSFAQPFAHADP
jgi:hypothetical protein